MSIEDVTSPRAGRPLLELPDKYCLHCGKKLVRKMRTDRPFEPSEAWAKRRYCGRECGNSGRQRRSKASLEAIQWSPIIADAPTDNQCWAGFAAGRRCVLERDGHVTHRDMGGSEFVKLEPRRSLIDRNPGTNSFEEHLSMRSTWRSARRG